jgi:hypothetical protein
VNFRPELAAAVMDGRKIVTRRLLNGNPRSPWGPDCRLRPGRDYAVCPGRGKDAIGRVRIVSVRLEQLNILGAYEAEREGFASVWEFEAAWESIHGTYDPALWVWRVEFEVVS